MLIGRGSSAWCLFAAIAQLLQVLYGETKPFSFVICNSYGCGSIEQKYLISSRKCFQFSMILAIHKPVSHKTTCRKNGELFWGN